MVDDERRLTRKLAAVLYADVAGYSRLTGEDEDGTHRRLSAYLDLIAEQIQSHSGRVVHYAGDAVLAEFPTVTEALTCAARVQQSLGERNQSLAPEQRVEFRVGINLGEVIVDRSDIYGDGVNVAARLEGLAEAGGICISESAYTAAGRKLPFDYEFMGEREVKNIEKPVRAYHARLRDPSALPDPTGGDGEGTQRRNTPLMLAAAVVLLVAVGGGLAWFLLNQPPRDDVSIEEATQAAVDKPSIAVLPFSNMSGEPEQDYFGDGIAEDIITDLSRLTNLSVIARNSSFAFKGVAAQVQDIGRDLGARYVLEGSVRRSGEQVRINAQLIDAGNGHHLWAQRYDRELNDIFAVQDDITRRIVSELAVRLTGGEEARLARRSTNNFEAYDLFLQGRRYYNQFDEEGFARAEQMYKRAIELDPGYARAHGALAVTLTDSILYDTDGSVPEKLNRALELARTAVALDPESPQAYWALGYAQLRLRNFEQASAALDKAIALSPNDGDAHALLALINNAVGNGEEAIRLIKKAMLLNPHYNWGYPYNLGRGYYQTGEYDKAIPHLLDAIERNPSIVFPHLYLAATYARLGEMDDAEWEVTQIEMLDPDFTLSHFSDQLSLRDDVAEKLLNDLRAAGMAE